MLSRVLLASGQQGFGTAKEDFSALSTAAGEGEARAQRACLEACRRYECLLETIGEGPLTDSDNLGEWHLIRPGLRSVNGTGFVREIAD